MADTATVNPKRNRRPDKFVPLFFAGIKRPKGCTVSFESDAAALKPSEWQDFGLTPDGRRPEID